MATAKKKTTTKSTAKKKNTKNTKTAYTAPPEAQDAALSRSVQAAFFVVLAVLAAVSIFTEEGSFIMFFSNFAKGLIGWGFYLLCPIFIIIAVILVKNKTVPVGFRVFATLNIPVFFSSLISLSVYPGERVKTAAELMNLFELGQSLKCGGLLSGVIAVLFEKAFSIYGAYALVVIALIFFVLKAFDSGLSSVAGTLRSSADRYSEYDAPFTDYEVPAKQTKKSGAKKQEPAPVKKAPRSSAFPVDVPLDDLDDYDDALSISEPAKPTKKIPVKTVAREELPAEETKPARKVTPSAKQKTAAKNESATARVKPLSDEEAAEIAGVKLPDKEPEKAAKKIERISRQEIENEAVSFERTISRETGKEKKKSGSAGYAYPPVDLLKSSEGIVADAKDEILTNRARLEAALHSFGINASIVGITHGPTVTRYDIELEQGVKLSKITNLAGDLALSLGVVNVRVAPIPDKISTVGIEVPNRIINTVYLKDVIDSDKFRSAKSKLSFAVGKDIGGECIVGNISKLPHMLIAGTTGSGKSVCMNSLIISLLYKARPDEVKMIMIDPKMVELGVYNGIPHLYVPVVTDPKKAAGALQWSVVEMLKRYRLFSEASVRNLESYNEYCTANGLPTMPNVVIVIDELADLMIAASKEVEESICRVAQMGRAAGMHLIIATQRPSADVITGLMKANIPSRIAFAVSSSLESRIIMDQAGAEKLIGMGDMLYAPVGCGKPTRVQGAFVSDEEREEIIQFIKEQGGETTISKELTDFMNQAAQKAENGGAKESKAEKSTGGYDPELANAVEVVIEMKSCSVSMLQRRVKLGYARAARIVDQMEELGVVGPYEGSKPRAVLVDETKWREMKRELGLGDDADADSLLGTDSEDY